MVERTYNPWEQNLQKYLDKIVRNFYAGKYTDDQFDELTEKLYEWWKEAERKGLAKT